MRRNQFTALLTICLVLSAAVFGFSSKRGAVPAEIVGKWKWGTINPVWFSDSYTGEYKGHGGGVSAFFEFEQDGRFRHFTYIETNTNGWKTQVLTRMEGKVVVHGDMFRLKVEKGSYKSRSNTVKKHNYDRPMNDQERESHSSRDYRWKVVYGEGGSRSIEITPGGKGSPSVFVPAK